LNKYLTLLVNDCVKSQKWHKASENIIKFGVPKDEMLFPGYEKLAIFAINSEDAGLVSNARDILYQVEQVKPSFTSKSTQYLEILHILKQRNEAMAAPQLGKLAAKCASALLRHLDIYEMDKAFYIAGKLAKVESSF
jgi:hypothetical protein